MRALHVVPLLFVPSLALAGVRDDATESIALGTFLPFTDTPASETHSAKTIGTYDGARGGALLMTAVEAKLSETFQVQGAIDVEDGEAQPAVEAQVDLLDRKHDGFDLQVAGGLDANGFNEVPSVFARATVGAYYRETYLIGTVGFELGTERGESASHFGLAGVRDLGDGLYMGFDSHVAFDLERDVMEPEGEASWVLQAGPLVSFPIGRFALTAGFGMSAREERNAMSSDLGAYGSLGAGAVF